MTNHQFDPGRIPFRHRGEGRLSAEQEDIIQRVIGAAIEVHRALGPGYLEEVYEEALAVELEHRGIRFQRQLHFEICYRDRIVGTGRLDMLIENQIVLELKSVETMKELFTAQTISYLKATHKQVALLINFNVPLLKNGLHRILF